MGSPLYCDLCKRDVPSGGHPCEKHANGSVEEHLATCSACKLFHEPHCAGSRAAVFVPKVQETPQPKNEGVMSAEEVARLCDKRCEIFMLGSSHRCELSHGHDGHHVGDGIDWNEYNAVNPSDDRRKWRAERIAKLKNDLARLQAETDAEDAT